jgi:hypothetical protein
MLSRESGSVHPRVTPLAADRQGLPIREFEVVSAAVSGLRSAAMRHVRTLLAALVIAPLAWTILAFGQDRAAQAITDAGTEDAVHAGDVVRALVILSAAGLLLGLIASLRVSPVGAAVTGAAYLAAYAGLLIVPEQVLEAFNRTVSVAGMRGDLSTPLRTGSAALLGAMLLVAVVSVGRWRRWPQPSEPIDMPAFDAHGALGAYGLSPDVTYPGTGNRYLPMPPGPPHTAAQAADLSWPDTLRNTRQR